MTGPSTDELVSELARDLTPVRRLPSLRAAAAGIGLAFAAAVALAAWAGGPKLGASISARWNDPASLALWIGLAAAAVGALTAALAGSVPGRDAAAGVGRGLAALGGAWAAGAGVWVVSQAGAAPMVPWGASVPCIASALWFGLGPVLIVGGFVARGVTPSPALGAAAATLGSAALGAAAVHASCGVADGGHVFVAHLAAPVGVGLLLAPVLAARLRGKSSTD